MEAAEADLAPACERWEWLEARRDACPNPQTLSNREKTLLVDALKDAYRFPALLTAVQRPLTA